jgi:membrane protein implicated in regulation of membrane protease activity
MTLTAFVWLTVALVAAIIEIILPTFGFIFAAGGAVAAAGVAALGGGTTLQIATFIIVLLLSLVLIRPRLVASLGSRGVPSRTEALIGKTARVTDDINPTLGTGRINVAGEDWAAASDRLISVGTDVRVTGADGIVLRVTPAE